MSDQKTQSTTITNSATETTIVTGVAGERRNVTSLVIANTSATNATVTIRDATGGGTARVFRVPANDTRGIAGVEWRQATAGANWTAQSSDAVTSIVVTATFEVGL